MILLGEQRLCRVSTYDYSQQKQRWVHLRGGLRENTFEPHTSKLTCFIFTLPYT